MKVCTKCRREKPASEFGKNKQHRDGLDSWCRTCIKKRNRERWANDPDYRKRRNGIVREYQAAHPDVRRKSHFKRDYGLTLDQHKAMYLAQNGCCGLCHEPVEYDKTDTDHDHKTGRVRGLLCRRCNLLIGNIENNDRLLYDAFKWIGW